MDNGFQGKEGQQVPEMTDEVVNNISSRYVELYELITGKEFIKENMTEEAIEQRLIKEIEQLNVN